MHRLYYLINSHRLICPMRYPVGRVSNVLDVICCLWIKHRCCILSLIFSYFWASFYKEQWVGPYENEINITNICVYVVQHFDKSNDFSVIIIISKREEEKIERWKNQQFAWNKRKEESIGERGIQMIVCALNNSIVGLYFASNVHYSMCVMRRIRCA